jgi:tRNA A37 methylthiotransferase MiaB
VKGLAERGFKEIVLTGTQLTQYGWDINTNLYQLLLELLRIKDIELFRLSSLYPSEIDPKSFWTYSHKKKGSHPTFTFPFKVVPTGS